MDDAAGTREAPGPGDTPDRSVPRRRTDAFTVRTFNPRRGPMTATARDRLETVLPAYEIGDGPIDATAVFGRTAPLVLEIGAGYGHAALAYARTHPGHDLLAIDVHVPGLARLAAEASAEGLGNVRVSSADAVAVLAGQLGPGSLLAVHLFFPDPWPKRRHHKRRFVRAERLDLLAERLVAGGTFLVATDKVDYAADAERELSAHPSFEVVGHDRPAWRPGDGYEAKGRAAGRDIHELTARRR